MMSPSMSFSPLAAAQGQGQRRVGGGIRVQLFRDPDPEGEERVAEDVSGAQKDNPGHGGQGQEETGTNSQPQQVLK